jgi:hypothetical protein
MPNRLGSAVSPYLRSHADNPVDWFPWGAEAFAEAAARDVPVLISIGYSTCHWCHVMARESFSDPALAAYLNANFVCVKVDREEYPDVDAAYLAAASAFTDQLGWPLTVIATPQGRAFYAGTYFPPVPTGGLPSFRAVLEAMAQAWADQRDEVLDSAGRLAAALSSASAAGSPDAADAGSLPTSSELSSAVDLLQSFEDAEFGGFGGAPKFPVSPVLGFLLDRGDLGDRKAMALARRTLAAMAASPLRDAVEGGFFRYSTRRDWSEPHYERMLYDNALLLDAYSRVGSARIAEGIAGFLLETLRQPDGGFASGQDSESTVDGKRVEGGYYLLAAPARAKQVAPALDTKTLTGWNGLAISALANAGNRLGHPAWVDAAIGAAGLVSTGSLVRARIGPLLSEALPTLEDFGMLARGLVDLALATGDVRFAERARELVLSTVRENGFAVPGGADPVLLAQGLAQGNDPSDGAYPSGLSAISEAALALDALGADGALRGVVTTALAAVAPLALARPVSFGSVLGVFSRLAAPRRALVVVDDDRDSALGRLAIEWTGGVSAVVTGAQARAFARAGFSLFEARGTGEKTATAYLCEDFVCQLPVTDTGALAVLLTARE